MHVTAPPIDNRLAPVRDDLDTEGLGLLLDLMVDDPIPPSRPAGPPRPGWSARAQQWSQRASSWGAGPQGAWRAW